MAALRFDLCDTALRADEKQPNARRRRAGSAVTGSISIILCLLSRTALGIRPQDFDPTTCSTRDSNRTSVSKATWAREQAARCSSSRAFKPLTREAIEQAREPKELAWIDGATHVDLYDKDEYIPTAITKLTDFFETHLGKTTTDNRPERSTQPTMTS